MLEWMMVIYAVNTRQVVVQDPGRYPTEEVCRHTSMNLTENGKTYAVCRPVSVRSSDTN